MRTEAGEETRHHPPGGRPGGPGADRDRRRPLPTRAGLLALAVLLVAVALLPLGCTGEEPVPARTATAESGTADATAPDTENGAGNANPAAADPTGPADAADPTGPTDPADPQVLDPAGPGDPDPGLDEEPYAVDEMEDGKVDDRSLTDDGEPLVPEGFEDVAPGTDGLVDGPFTDDEPADGEREAGGQDAAVGEEAGGEEGADEGAGGTEAAGATAVGAVWVYLVVPADDPPAAARGRGEAGSGERQRPQTDNNGQYAGSFGCGDRLVGLKVELEEPVEVAGREEHVRQVLQTLLDLAPEDVPGDLLNSLRRSPLEVESVEPAPGRPGIYQARLSGPLRIGGTCDAPRVRAQLTATGEQVEGVDEVEIFLGDEPLEVVLSTRGTVRR